MDITVDGSEIRRSPDEVGSLIPLFSTGFQHHQRGGFLARFLPAVFCNPFFPHLPEKVFQANTSRGFRGVWMF